MKLLDGSGVRLEEGTATVVVFFDGRVSVSTEATDTIESGAVMFAFDSAKEVAEMLSRLKLIGTRDA